MNALGLFIKQDPPPYRIDMLATYLVKVKDKFFPPSASYVDILTSVAIRAGMDLDRLPDPQALESECIRISSNAIASLLRYQIKSTKRTWNGLVNDHET
jgi:hypothetical protein